MSDVGEPAPSAAEKVVEAEIATHAANFKRHRKELLDILRKEQTEPFDDNAVWKKIEFTAWVYLQREVTLRREKARMSDANRVKLLHQLEDALSKARSLANKAMKTVRGHWFTEWAEVHGNPDFTNPIIHRYDEEFDKRVAVLKELEEAAYRATETVRKKRGRPPGKANLPHDFILTLAGVYRDITKRKPGAGSGPFAQFTRAFLSALGRECAHETVIEAIKIAKKREEKHPATGQWGRDFWDGMGGKIPPVRSNYPS